MPSPTASMTPAPSLWGMALGNGIMRLRLPARNFTSDGFTPNQWRWTRTSPGPGRGAGKSTSCSTWLAGPVSE